jgi:hypothetical protein
MDELNEAFAPVKGSELTPAVAALDTDRDNLFNGLRNTITAWARYHYEPQKKAAAQKFDTIIKSYGPNISKLRYQQQTATLNGIINDFEAENNIIDLELLGLAAWTTLLKNTNNAFNTSYLDRTEELSEHQLGVVHELRELATAQYRVLQSIFNARAAVAATDGTPVASSFEETGNALNTLITQYNQAVTRFSKKQNTDLPEENPVPMP